MPGFTGDLEVDLERGQAECASKTIMTHLLEKGFHGQRKMIKVRIQAVAETAQVASKTSLSKVTLAGEGRLACYPTRKATACMIQTAELAALFAVAA
jgi:hypothetical protein